MELACHPHGLLVPLDSGISAADLVPLKAPVLYTDMHVVISAVLNELNLYFIYDYLAVPQNDVNQLSSFLGSLPFRVLHN